MEDRKKDTASNQAEPKWSYTTKEIEELHLPLASHIEKLPEPKICEFCGRTLYHEGCLFMGKIITIMNTPQRCNCEQSVAYWKERERIEQERSEREQKEKEHKELLARYKKAGIDKRHMDCTFNNYVCSTPEQKKAFDILKDYLVNFEKYAAAGRSLYIEGTYGTGKTHLATAIAKHLIKQGKRVICRTPSELLISVRNTYDNHRDFYWSEQEVIDRFKKVDLLIIDDFGKQKPTEWGMATMYDIINYRYNEMLPTIVTTNFNEEDLIEKLSGNGTDPSKIESIISRFHQSADVVTMAWEDYRGGTDG